MPVRNRQSSQYICCVGEEESNLVCTQTMLHDLLVRHSQPSPRAWEGRLCLTRVTTSIHVLLLLPLTHSLLLTLEGSGYTTRKGVHSASFTSTIYRSRMIIMDDQARQQIILLSTLACLITFMPLSTACSLCMRRNCTISCKVTGHLCHHCA